MISMRSRSAQVVAWRGVPSCMQEGTTYALRLAVSFLFRDSGLLNRKAAESRSARGEDVEDS